MNALAAISLLEKKDFRYTNSQAARWFLVEESPEFLGNLYYLSDLWNSFGSLKDAIKKGGTVKSLDKDQRDPEEIARYISSQHSKGKINAPLVTAMINLKKINKILDLGGCSGIYSAEFLKINPALDINIFDTSDIIPFTRQYLAEKGISNKINIIEGDYFTDDFGEGYDFVFLSFMISKFSIWKNIELGKKIYRSIKPGGKIIIHDYLLSDDRMSPCKSTFESLNLLLESESGEVYTQTDLWIILKESWFRKVTYEESGNGTFLISAEK
jgi:SAM-dependent methyltransferase